jgi:TolA-binding protein
VMDDFTEWPGLKAQLGNQVLYQSERASLELRDMASATNAVDQILRLNPPSLLADRSLLLLGQGYADLDEPQIARDWLGRLVQMSPDSPLRPEAELAVARTFAQKSDWPNAKTNYDAWLERFPTNDLRPRVEFDRAWVSWQSGQETNALTQFTSFVSQFATNELAPAAQWWVADYYFRQNDFLSAERNYKVLFQTWTNSDLAYKARMMAGRAAVGRSKYDEAVGYFTNLTSDLNCPTNLWLEAMFDYGGTLMLQNPNEATNNSANLILAIRVFGKIHDTYTNTESAAMAWGEKGKCYFQLAAQDAGNYELASNAFQQAVSVPYASVAVRNRAKVGLAIVAEKLAQRTNGEDRTTLLKQARDYYLDVFYDNDLRGDEKPDLFWKEKAGLEAARLMTESLESWSQALNLYRHLQQMPQKQGTYEKKIAAAQEHLDRGKK